jgi:hypothetical protein
LQAIDTLGFTVPLTAACCRLKCDSNAAERDDNPMDDA